MKCFGRKKKPTDAPLIYLQINHLCYSVSGLTLTHTVCLSVSINFRKVDLFPSSRDYRTIVQVKVGTQTQLNNQPFYVYVEENPDWQPLGNNDLK